MSKWTGFSLTFCVTDLCLGRLRVWKVEKIVAGTAFTTGEEWEAAIERYKKEYWDRFPEQAEKIVRYLLMEGKIDQPRLRGEVLPEINVGEFYQRWREE